MTEFKSARGLTLDAWSLTFERDVPHDERTREALCTLANGRFGTRGSACEAPGKRSNRYPGTYAAGIYDRSSSVIDGTALEFEELVNLPSWLPLTLAGPTGIEFSTDFCETLEYRQVLDLSRGFLNRLLRLRDRDGRTLLMRERRFVHLRENRLAGLELSIEVEGWTGPLRIRSLLDGRVDNTNADEYEGLDRQHFDQVQVGGDATELTWLRTHTRRSRIDVSLATRTRVTIVQPHGVDRHAPERQIEGSEEIALEYVCPVAPGTRLTIEKLAALHTSRDYACAAPAESATRLLHHAPDFASLSRAQESAWRRLWSECRFELPGHPAVLGALRLHMFHLLQIASPYCSDIDSSVPARGLHGENYRGHIFWDESFVFWVFSLRWPELTRRLLLYRHRRLDEARAAARRLGLRGALFPWRSASDGREVTEPLRRNTRTGRWIPDRSHLQRHIGAAIAYNVWQYLQVTVDDSFAAGEGAELILSIALFWSSIACLESDGRYHIRGVVGPDEFHEAYPDADRPGIDDNAYTNVMAVWVLLRARELIDRLPLDVRAALLEQLEIDRAELERWEDVSRRMYVPIAPDGLIEQFEGFSRLQRFDWAGYRARYRDVQRLDNILDEEGDTTDRYQVCKQPDVLMLFYLLPLAELDAILERLSYRFEPGAYARNVEYYLARTSHGSTLSRVVAAWVLRRVDCSRSWAAFNEALGSDLCDLQHGSTREGIHVGAMAAGLDVFQRAYLGLEPRTDRLCLHPDLPPALSELQLRLRYRGQWLQLHTTRAQLRIRSEDENQAPVRLQITDRVLDVVPGSEHVVELDSPP